jgi:hypothetical protein
VSATMSPNLCRLSEATVFIALPSAAASPSSLTLVPPRRAA